MKNNSKKILALVAVVLVVVLMAFAYSTFSEKPVAGAKAITIEVVNSAQESITYEVNTDAQFLQQAMDEAEGLEYTYSDGPYGPMVETINGESAIYETDGAYWGFYVNGDYCNYGISEQPVENGDAFQIVWTKA
ncbi:MAG: DUF4430 domain-containing protein [Oscillospiraceae bacterium]|nr:DUF4430 domain-containing protein [Oscillospiraceae bacterium]